MLMGAVDQPEPRPGDPSHSDVNQRLQRLGGDYGSACVLGLKLKGYRGPSRPCQEDTNRFLKKWRRTLLRGRFCGGTDIKYEQLAAHVVLFKLQSDGLRDVCLLWKVTSLKAHPPPEKHWKHFSTWTLTSALKWRDSQGSILCPNEREVVADY